jgi:hypothetical protein
MRRERVSRERAARCWTVLVAPVALLLAGSLAACGADDEASSVVIRGADEIQVMTPAEVASAREANADVAAQAAADEADGTTSDTIAVADDRTPEERLFDSFAQFRGCLEQRGTEFIGVPDPANPESPTNDPAYLESLGVCASQSNILASLEDVQTAADDLSPEEVEQRNEGVLLFRDCMEGRGYTVDLQSGPNGALSPTGIESPDGGQFDLDSRDMEACASDAQAAVEGEGG